MDGYEVVTQLNDNQINQLIKLLKQTWWAKDRTKDEIDLMLKNSMSFGLIDLNTGDLIGYSRVLTDEMKYAFIFDVIVNEALRGAGLGKFLIRKIMEHPRFKNIKNFELTCAPDMVKFYEKFGFSEDYGVQSKPMRCKVN